MLGKLDFLIKSYIFERLDMILFAKIKSSKKQAITLKL